MRLVVAETAAERHPAGNSPAVVESFLAETAAVEIVVVERPVEVGRNLAAVGENSVVARLTAEFLAPEPIGCWLAAPVCCLAGLSLAAALEGPDCSLGRQHFRLLQLSKGLPMKRTTSFGPIS